MYHPRHHQSCEDVPGNLESPRSGRWDSSLLKTHLWNWQLQSAGWVATGRVCFSGTLVVVVVLWLSCVQLFVTPWTVAFQASLSFPVFWSLLKFVSIESVMPSNHLILYFPPCPPALNLSQQFIWRKNQQSHTYLKPQESPYTCEFRIVMSFSEFKSIFPGAFGGVRAAKIVFRGQVCSHGWAWVCSEVSSFVTKTTERLGSGVCCIHLKGTSFSPKEKFLF